MLEAVKLCIIGKAHRFPTDNLRGDGQAPCEWDCYRRATMLEPLIDELFDRNVPGDFCEAVVFKGGISIFMASALAARDGTRKRKMFLADSFRGLPEPNRRVNDAVDTIVSEENKRTKWIKGRFAAGLGLVKNNFNKCYRNHNHKPERFSQQTTIVPIVGFFNESLPGPIKSLSLLRIDGDLYTSIYDALEGLYELVSPGGFVVFDDYKFVQAQRAIHDFRASRGILEPLQFYNSTLDAMTFWKKSVDLTV
jgi:hypothetical protein